MQPVQDRIPAYPLRRLQLRLRPMLRPVSRHHQTRQGQSRGDAGRDSPVQAEPTSFRDRWFAERAGLGTRLSTAEIQHGVNAGIISSTLLIGSQQ